MKYQISLRDDKATGTSSGRRSRLATRPTEGALASDHRSPACGEPRRANPGRMRAAWTEPTADIRTDPVQSPRRQGAELP